MTTLPGRGERHYYDKIINWLLTSHNADGTIKLDALEGIPELATQEELDTGLDGKADQLAFEALSDQVEAHQDDTANPHSVTATQVGLGNANNTSDANKPVSIAQQAALDLKADQADLDATDAIVSGHTSTLATHTTQIAYTNPGDSGSNRQIIKVIDSTPTWQDAPVFDVRDDEAAADGATDDTAAIAVTTAAAAAVATANQHAIIALAPVGNHKVGRRVVGSQTNGGIFLERGVSLDGRGATITLDANCAFITARNPTIVDDAGTGAVTATITANVAVADTAYTVDSTTGFAVGDEVFVRLNNNAYDSAETKDPFYAKVLTVTDATHITLDRPSPAACTVASTAAANKVIQKLHEPLDGFFVRDVTLINPMTGSANAEAGIDFRYARNAVIENITAENPGPGAVVLAYPENVTVRNVRVRTSDDQGGSAKGRAINIWNAKNVLLQNIYAEHFERGAIFVESYSSGVTFDGLHIVNNFPGRVHASYPLITINQGSQAHLRDVIVEGYGQSDLIGVGGTTATCTIENLWLNTADQILGGLDLGAVSGVLRLGATTYDTIKRHTAIINLSPSMTNQSFTLPHGRYREVKVYVSSATGITQFYLTGSSNGNNRAGLLVGGSLVEMPGNYFTYGSAYPFNNQDSHLAILYTDGTVPAGAVMHIEIEYWASSTDTATRGKLVRSLNPQTYAATNVTTDRSYDANATTLDEVADVLGTLIADLKQSGWIA